jgi:thioesterase DpgC
VLRGDVVPAGKYAGRRVYNAGINLTHLYYGKIPFLVVPDPRPRFREQDVRGLAVPDVPPDEVAGDSIEKLWISASRPSRSAAAARSCLAPTSTSPRATPT